MGADQTVHAPTLRMNGHLDEGIRVAVLLSHGRPYDKAWRCGKHMEPRHRSVRDPWQDAFGCIEYFRKGLLAMQNGSRAEAVDGPNSCGGLFRCGVQGYERRRKTAFGLPRNAFRHYLEPPFSSSGLS